MKKQNPVRNKSFNQTSVELKRATFLQAYRLITSFNQTSVELKPITLQFTGVGAYAFNQTSVELKRGRSLKFFLNSGVLLIRLLGLL